MKTIFKIFKSNWGYYTIEDNIKEYQEKHNVEIKDILLIKSEEDEPVIGVVFEMRSEDENK